MSDYRIEAAAKAMREKRGELQHLPLDRIYDALAEAAVLAFHSAMAKAASDNLESLDRIASG